MLVQHDVPQVNIYGNRINDNLYECADACKDNERRRFDTAEVGQIAE